MKDLDRRVTVRQAYLGMFEYLRRYYERGKSDEIGSMLGELSLLQDEGSADPAAMADFRSSIEAVIRAESEGGYDAVNFRLS